MAISLESLKRSSPLPPRDLVYGVQGIGKSTLASLMPSPVFLAAEDGLSGLEGVAHWEVRTYQDAVDALSALHGEHQFQTAVFDTVTAFEPMLHRRMLELWGVDSIDKVGANGGGFYKWRLEALPLWQNVLDGLDSLRVNRGMRIMLIGHSTEKEIKPPEADPYRKYALDLLNDKAASLLYRWADVGTTEAEFRIGLGDSRHPEGLRVLTESPTPKSPMNVRITAIRPDSGWRPSG